MHGHLFIRHPQLLRTIFGTDSRVLLQHGKNDAYPTWKTVRRSVVRSARDVLLELLLERFADVQASGFYSTLLACAKRCQRAQHITAPWYIWEQKVRDIKEKWGHTWVFEGCDKNMGKIAATCRVGMLQRVLHDIADPLQFEVLHIAPDARGARKWALAHLHHNAYRALRGCVRFKPWDALYRHSRHLWLNLRLNMTVDQVPEHWASASRMLSPLRDIDWKTRLVFSHYRHPIRARGRHVSRCLQLLITEGTRVLHTLEMPHCKDLLP